MDCRVVTLLAGGVLAAALPARAQAPDPVSVAVRAFSTATADSAAVTAIHETIVTALKADSRIEVESAAQYVVIGGGARTNGAIRLDLRIASVAAGTMTPLSFVLPDGTRAQAATGVARDLAAKILELAGRT